ncbi:aldehyde dehydrogenase family protein [Burkholderia sp. NRF60-BP8]|uniref:aldehyde dehydrogenase family protein n=1 Tax=Burkholderia sp. NRF60-BP8 TaxID=1637853 RepID=UPI0009EB4F9F|nr:aldehyde dehydrogenase family protein [Burkholderia sp. NRF60-BP8]
MRRAAVSFARQIAASQRSVNEIHTQGVDIPFGGHKQSGLGTEHGNEGRQLFTNLAWRSCRRIETECLTLRRWRPAGAEACPPRRPRRRVTAHARVPVSATCRSATRSDSHRHPRKSGLIFPNTD